MQDVRVAPLRSASCLSRPRLWLQSTACSSLFAQQKEQIGRRGGKRVMFVVQANNFARPYSLMRNDTVDL